MIKIYHKNNNLLPRFIDYIMLLVLAIKYIKKTIFLLNRLNKYPR